jgi:putative oxidoreductase
MTGILWLLRLALAGVYLYAAWPKIVDPAGFAKAIYNYQMVPDAFINLMAVFLPWLELFAALALLLVPPLRRGALLLIAAMTVVFIAAIGIAMARGINIDCGCFSTTGQGMRTGWLHLLLDFGLLACCVALFRLERRT